jgi:hypothetical protein
MFLLFSTRKRGRKVYIGIHPCEIPTVYALQGGRRVSVSRCPCAARTALQPARWPLSSAWSRYAPPPAITPATRLYTRGLTKCACCGAGVQSCHDSIGGTIIGHISKMPMALGMPRPPAKSVQTLPVQSAPCIHGNATPSLSFSEFCRGSVSGEPCFDKLEAMLAHGMLSLPATKVPAPYLRSLAKDAPTHMYCGVPSFAPLLLLPR